LWNVLKSIRTIMVDVIGIPVVVVRIVTVGCGIKHEQALLIKEAANRPMTPGGGATVGRERFS